jgi:hypothetical protein
MSKLVSLVVTYETDTKTIYVDSDASKALFVEGPCWDRQSEHWFEDSGLVNDVSRRLTARLESIEPSNPERGRSVSVEAQLIELALNIIDPDDSWDVEATLEFSDAAKEFLSDYPLTTWEIEGGFALVAQFVRDWAVAESGIAEKELAFDGAASVSSRVSTPSSEIRTVTNVAEVKEFAELTTVETENPLTKSTLRVVVGEYDGAPTLALFVGEDEKPILIDRSALQIAIEQCESTDERAEPALSFMANTDLNLGVIELDIDFGSYE